MKMPKPIVVVYVDKSTPMPVLEDMFNAVKNSLTDEYHVLILPSNKEDTKIEVFYEKDFNEVK